MIIINLLKTLLFRFSSTQWATADRWETLAMIVMSWTPSGWVMTENKNICHQKYFVYTDQGELEGGSNCFWHRKDMKLLYMHVSMCQLLSQQLGWGHVTFIHSRGIAKLVKCRTTWVTGWEGLRIVSTQIHIPNREDVLKLCYNWIGHVLIHVTWGIVFSNK